jgi:hypothetical protein
MEIDTGLFPNTFSLPLAGRDGEGGCKGEAPFEAWRMSE